MIGVQEECFCRWSSALDGFDDWRHKNILRTAVICWPASKQTRKDVRDLSNTRAPCDRKEAGSQVRHTNSFILHGRSFEVAEGLGIGLEAPERDPPVWHASAAKKLLIGPSGPPNGCLYSDRPLEALV